MPTNREAISVTVSLHSSSRPRVSLELFLKSMEHYEQIIHNVQPRKGPLRRRLRRRHRREHHVVSSGDAPPLIGMTTPTTPAKPPQPVPQNSDLTLCSRNSTSTRATFRSRRTIRRGTSRCQTAWLQHPGRMPQPAQAHRVRPLSRRH